MMHRVVLFGLALALNFVCTPTAGAQSAEEAWKKLVGTRLIKRPGFKYIENNPKLPNVLIYGDSISIDYTPFARYQLKDRANVYRLHTNGGDSSTFIAKINKLHEVMSDEKLKGHWDFKWDVITVNVGLHDLKYWDGKKLNTKTGKQVTTPENYEKQVRALLEFLKKDYPNTSVIFVTTTPVPEKSGGRKAGDAAKYNEIAQKVLKDFPNVMVCDLYSFTKPNQPKWWTKPGNVHFNLEGRKAQGAEVAKAIAQALEKREEDGKE